MTYTVSKKKNEISYMNILLCLLVVFIHVSSEPVSKLDKSGLPYIFIMVPWRLSAFVVQGFIFLSSLKIFLKPISHFDYLSFIKNRVKTILFPYVIWVMVYYLYFVSIGYFPFNIKDYLLYLVTGSIVSPFYFIIIIFQFYLLMPLWLYIFKTFKINKILIASLLVMVLGKLLLPMLFYDFKYFDRVFLTYIFYWILGCAFGLNYEKYKSKIKRHKKTVLVSFILLAVSDAFLSYFAFAKGISIPYLEYVHVFYCIVAVLFIFSVFADINIKNKYISLLDNSSFSIYLSHCYIMNWINRILIKIGIDGILWAYVFRFLLVYSITISICILYNKSKKIILKRYN